MSIIGICGNARSGKDTLADLLIEILQENGVKTQKLSFANQLKEESRDFLLKTIGIDSFTTDDEEKKIIRPFLVTWGTHVRRKIDPMVWVRAVEKQMDPNAVLLIPDVRYRNEYDWLREQDSYCVFVDRALQDGTNVPPANDEEERENLFLRANSDFQLSWGTVGEENKQWLVAVAGEVLQKTVSEETLKQWIRTSHS